MGDVAMCVPVVYSLAKKYSGLEIVFLSRKNFAPIFSRMPQNVKFVGIDLKNDYKGMSGLNRLFREIKEMKIDAYADFHDVLRTHYLRIRTFLAGIKTEKINKGRADKRRLTKKGAVNCKPLKTTFERYHDVLKRLGFDFELDYPTKSRSEKTGKIGIAPFAAHKGKILPLETMEKVVEMLSSKVLKIYLFGFGDKEKAILDAWQDKYPNVESLVGRSGGLANELNLIADLDCMLSMDSANMHLASLVGTRAVSVWGATHPAAGFLGFNQNPDDAVQVDLPCRPCSVYGNKPCRLSEQYKCLTSITPESIVSRILGE